MSMVFGWLLKMVTGGALTTITDYLKTYANDKTASHEADTVLAASIMASQVQGEIEARKAQLAFTSRHDKLVTFIASGFAFHVWMNVLDATFHLNWHIATLPDPMGQWEGSILLSFFIVAPSAALGKAIIQKVWK